VFNFPAASFMDDTNSLIEQRKAKLAALRAKGIDPFKNKFTPTESCRHAREQYAEGREVALAGRITAHRDMGKSMFLDIRDQSGRMQIYAQKNILGDEQFAIFQHLDLADFIGVKGTQFTTKTNEISVKITGYTILAKALRPPPAKWHGLEDTEIRYRQRYLDLMASKAAAPGTSTTGFEKGSPGDVLLLRSEIIREIRNFMHTRGYVEVETPMMQAIPGGAAAQPFVTKHNALGCNFYLRIALELYLKRLLVGGVDKVFEIGRNFRNEGLSRKHNPEFTMLEAYQAFGDYESMMELVQSMICHVAEKVLGTLQLPYEHPNEIQSQINRAIEELENWKKTRLENINENELKDFWSRFVESAITELRACSEKALVKPSSLAAIQAGTVIYRLNEEVAKRLTIAANLKNQERMVTYVLLGQELFHAIKRFGRLRFESIDLTKWEKIRYRDLFKKAFGENWFQANSAQRLAFVEHGLGLDVAGRPRRKLETNSPRIELDLRIAHLRNDLSTVATLSAEMSKRKEYAARGIEDFEINQAVFEAMIEPLLIQPTFVTHLPKELVPLAKLSPDDPTTVEVFECCINGQEIAPAYTEQNDPIAQRERLEHQAGGEQQKLDEDFLVALEHGMPPAGGMGMGIDRLCMMLLGQESIRDVILFPQLKPK
jgi:lysyl-tRNA synthetase class 2